jgi:hypothetical protein
MITILDENCAALLHGRIRQVIAIAVAILFFG